MRKFILLLAACLTVSGLSAQQLVVHRTNGETVIFELGQTPVTTFEDGQLVITTTETTVFFPLDDIVKYTYEGVEPHAVTSVSTPFLRVHMDNGRVTIEGLDSRTEVVLLSADGQRLAVVKAQEAQPTVLPVDAWPAGVYIINAGALSYKFIKP